MTTCFWTLYCFVAALEICNSGEKYDSVLKTCVQCPVGMYREKGKDSPETCIECPSPFTTESPGARDISFCVRKYFSKV